ncbi:RNA-binding protein 45 [Platysternon megacephalum]|uniref:RNA-binding protein 45 n=1 Tax=Platysternon megacephalum TaxID=55544 RepID=A0A4D9F9W1_9SAUR|nr:RNA-binding protein 45 [Platysternon megacephalum]
MCEILVTFKLFQSKNKKKKYTPTLLLKACKTIIQHQRNVVEKMETKEKFHAFLQKVIRAGEEGGSCLSAVTTALLHNRHLPVHSPFPSCRCLLNRLAILGRGGGGPRRWASPCPVP